MNEFRIDCGSVDEFLALIRRSNANWWSDKHSLKCGWVFRGQFDAEWGLLPRVWREPDPLSDLRQRMQHLRSGPGDSSPLVDVLVLQANTELEAISQFAKLAQELRFPIDEIPVSPIQSERLLTDGAISGFCLKIPPCAAIAQHHGIPTRLLDWTRDPMHAAYFAVAHCFRPPGLIPKRIAVWALQFERLLSFGQFQFATMQVPFRVDDFIHAQRGLFTYIDNAEYALCDEPFSLPLKWPALDKLLWSSAYPQRLRCITLPFSDADELLLRLDREGISRACLMPTLDHVGNTIIDRWKYGPSAGE